MVMILNLEITILLFVLLMVSCLADQKRCIEKVDNKFVNNHQCTNNDTYCGDWKDRQYFPLGCTYRQLSTKDAQKCMAHKTVACMGDSQLRGLCAGLASILYGFTVDSATDKIYHESVAEQIGKFDFITLLQQHHDHVLKPIHKIVLPSKTEEVKNGFTWQVQQWSVNKNDGVSRYMKGILTNKYMEGNEKAAKNGTQTLNDVDFALWNHGFHETDMWDVPPFGEHFYSLFVTQYLVMRQKVPVPVVWTSLNTECWDLKERIYQYQVPMVHDANYYVPRALKVKGVPYFDADKAIRAPGGCVLSTDGVHPKHWVDVVRANILLNHLCDDDNNWRGGIDTFMWEEQRS